jgi:alpha-L-rhamnosidase
MVHSFNDVAKPFDLRCEFTVNPIGLDITKPRFSWALNHPRRGQYQTAYQILVSSSLSKLMVDEGDVWDSGKVISKNSINIVFEGSPLESGKTYYWKIHFWDKDGNVSAWSEVAYFEMGLLNTDDWKGKWIQGGQLLRKEFIIEKEVERARVYVCGLGYYELRINGCKVGDKALDPGWTDYDKRVLYSTYDVTRQLKTGRNAIGLILGRGRHIEAYGYGPSKAILQLNIEFTDGTKRSIFTDDTWKASDGPIVSNDIYNGTKYDARLEKDGWDEPGYNDSSWSSCELAEHPKGKLVSSATLPPVRVVGHVLPIDMFNPRPGVYVYDFGQNFTGWVRLRVKGPAGSEVKLRYSELLREDGTLNVLPLRGAEATDVYILKGEGVEEFEPKFTYHGFRYVEVTGFPGVPTLESLEARVVHSDVESSGGFMCSNQLLNRVHKNIRWGQLSNLMSIPTDCPQRDERMGWLGDAQLSAELAILNFWMPSFYEKFMADIRDSQAEDGSIPDVVPPYWKLYPADPAWGTACVVIPWLLYVYYGDIRALQENYELIKRWVDFLTSQSVDHILSFSKYGDWCPPAHVRSIETPGELVSTWVYYHDVSTIAKIAKILGREEDFNKYSGLAVEIKEAFNRRFLKEDRYAAEVVPYLPSFLQSYSQTCNVLPLHLEMVPEEKVGAILKTLVEDIEVGHDKHLSTGIIGTRYILETLTRYGKAELAYAIATQRTYPSWGHMIELGATTIWERWEYLAGSGMNSHNHIMFGTVDSWLYKTLAGINVDPSAPAFEHIIIKPHVLSDLKYVSASLVTIRGTISSEWINAGDSLILKVTVPVNTVADVYVPKIGFQKVIISESGVVVWRGSDYLAKVDGIIGGREEGGFVVFSVGSGTYVFELKEERCTGLALSAT